MLKDELTIILLLKGRDDFTLRWFEYADATSLPCKIIVADGEHDHGMESLLRKKGFFTRLDCKYIQYPFDETIDIYFRKIADALAQVETPYVLLGSNDDFYLADALSASVRFLNNNPEYACSHGEVWDFSVASRHSGTHVYGDMGPLTKLYFHPTVSGESALERISEFPLKYHSIFHDVTRTDLLKDAFAKLLACGLDNHQFGDLCYSFMIAASGKMHRGDQLYMLHQTHPEMMALTDIVEPFWEWIQKERWETDLALFANCVAARATEIDSVDFHHANSEVLKSFLSKYILNKAVTLIENRPIESFDLSRLILLKIKSAIRRNQFMFRLAIRSVTAWQQLTVKKPGVGKIGALPPSFDEPLRGIKAFLKKEPPLSVPKP